MAYLIDTHALIWFLENKSQLSNSAKEIIVNPKNDCFVSIASLWEITIKVSLGKLPLNRNLSEIEELCKILDIGILPIKITHLQELQKLELHHRDPFDRLIISQAKAENLTIISKDENFRKYREIAVLW